MKHLFKIIAWFICLASCLYGVPAADSATLTISFKGIEKEHIGKEIYIGVWNKNTDDFLEDGTAEFTKKVVISSTQTSCTLDLPTAQTYALSCFIDEDGNEDLNSNFFGVPTEPYCFSNNYKPSFSAPDFEDCSFTLNKSMRMELSFL